MLHFWGFWTWRGCLRHTSMGTFRNGGCHLLPLLEVDSLLAGSRIRPGLESNLITTSSPSTSPSAIVQSLGRVTRRLPPCSCSFLRTEYSAMYHGRESSYNLICAGLR